MEHKLILLHVLNTACPYREIGTLSSKTSPVRGGCIRVTCPDSWTHARTHIHFSFVTLGTRFVTMVTRIQSYACNSKISNSHGLQCWNKVNYLGWRQERSNQRIKELRVPMRTSQFLAHSWRQKVPAKYLYSLRNYTWSHHRRHLLLSSLISWRSMQQVPLKRYYLCTKPHDVTFQKTIIFTFTAVITSKPVYTNPGWGEGTASRPPRRWTQPDACNMQF
jgi:hypothetical protein